MKKKLKIYFSFFSLAECVARLASAYKAIIDERVAALLAAAEKEAAGGEHSPPQKKKAKPAAAALALGKLAADPAVLRALATVGFTLIRAQQEAGLFFRSRSRFLFAFF